MQGIYITAGQSKSNKLKNQHMVASRPKKRKGSTFSQSPWHKVYLQGSELCHNIRTFGIHSVSEQEWAIATNTLCEKVDPNEATSKKRLVLSTHLMQQLLQPAPAFVLSGNNTALNHEIMLYFESRITLADACSLKCHSELDKTTNRQTCQRYSSIIKDFMKKMQKLESDFQSLERTTSILDIILEIQDLERFSVVNRLGKFHSRAKTIPRSAPQRYVNVEIHIPTNPPEPLHCLLL